MEPEPRHRQRVTGGDCQLEMADMAMPDAAAPSDALRGGAVLSASEAETSTLLPGSVEAEPGAGSPGGPTGLKRGGVGPAAGFFNIMKSCLGAGILATPAALAQSGWLLGAALLALAAGVSAYGCFLLNACAHRLGGRDTSFFVLFQRTFPRWGALADVLIVIECWGSVVGYLIIIGDDMAELAVSAWGLGEHTLWASGDLWRSLIFWGVIAPLTALPNLSMLKYSSSAGLLCVLVYCGVALLFAGLPGSFPACGASSEEADECRGEVVPVQSHVLSTLSLYFFIYGMQMKLFLVYNELAEPSIARMTNRVTSPAVGAALVVILATALPAYATFGDAVADNFLLSYPADSALVRAAVFANVLSVTASGPLTLHPARASAITLVDFCAARLTRRPVPSAEQSPRWHSRVWLASTLALLLLSFLPSLFVRNLGRFLALVGAVAGTGLIMWCPGVAFGKLFGGEEEEQRYGVIPPAVIGSRPAKLTDSAGPLFTAAQLRLHRICAAAMGWGGVLLMVVILVVDIVR
eukprot:jgi/Tetstr1/434617/TSEL_023708.t1